MQRGREGGGREEGRPTDRNRHRETNRDRNRTERDRQTDKQNRQTDRGRQRDVREKEEFLVLPISTEFKRLTTNLRHFPLREESVPTVAAKLT